LSIGWLLYFAYFVTVYSSLQDVAAPQLRATAIAVYFFFQYILGGGFGTMVTGALSDMFARDAMIAAAATEMRRLSGRRGCMRRVRLVVPLALLLTAIFLVIAAKTFVTDRDKVAAAGLAVQVAPA
jgi:MFS family permease